MSVTSSTWSHKQRLREDIIDAVVKGKYGDVESMLNEGADPNEAEGGYLTQRTLLILAIENDHIEIAHLLVKRGANLKASIMVNKVTKTVLDLAFEKQLDTLVALIEKTNAANNRLLQGVKDNNSSEVQGALQFGANCNILYDHDEDTENEDAPEINLLLFAICENLLDVARLLITSGIDLDFVLKWTDPASGEYTEDTARSLANRMHFRDIVNLIDKEKERREETRLTMQNGSTKGNNNSTTLSGKKEKSKSQEDEVEDIEDDDFQEAEFEASPNQSNKKRKSGGSCTIS